jgi:hypothetical protein
MSVFETDQSQTAFLGYNARRAFRRRRPKLRLELMPSVERTNDDRPPLPQFTLRSALALNAVIGVVLSIPLMGLGFSLTAAILAGLFALQLPFFMLFGAFRPGEAIAGPDEGK